MTEITIDPGRYAAITLAKGKHDNPGAGMCLMEAVAFLAGERFSDRPACVSPVLGEFGRNLNDSLPPPLRQELVALIPSLLGTAGDGYDVGRRYMALDWLTRVCLPSYLDCLPGCKKPADALLGLARIADRVAAQRARPVIVEAWYAASTADGGVGASAVGGASAAAVAVSHAADGGVGASAYAVHVALHVADNTSDGGVALRRSAIDLFAEMIKAPWSVDEPVARKV